MEIKDEVLNVLRERWAMIDDLCETFEGRATRSEIQNAVETLQKEGRARSKTYRGGTPFSPIFEKWFRAK